MRRARGKTAKRRKIPDNYSMSLRTPIWGIGWRATATVLA